MPTWLPWPSDTCDGVRVEHQDALLRISLASPENRNAQTPALWRRLAEIGQNLPTQVRVISVEAQGPSFSAGLDRRMFTPDGIPGERNLIQLASAPSGTAHDWIAEFQSAFTWLAECPAISIASVQGHAIGAGFQLALACDLILAADDAHFAMREVPLGLVPDLGGTQRLVRLIGTQRALWACATGQQISGSTAAQWGLAVASSPADELAAMTRDLVDQLLSAPPSALRAIKPLITGASERSREEQLQVERESQLALLRELTGFPVPPTNGSAR